MKRFIIRVIVSIGLIIVFSVETFLLQPDWITFLLAAYSPTVLYSVKTQERNVALSIDDGPDAHSTPKILDLLEQYDSHATFFLLTDNISGNEELVRQMVAQGHELGNHSIKDEASISQNEIEFEKKLLEAKEILAQYAPTRWFRPGSGVYDEEMIDIIEKNGYQCALGSVHPLDPQIPSASFSTWYILQNVQPGSIIILHDRGERGARTVFALREILPELQQKGFQVVTISNLVQAK